MENMASGSNLLETGLENNSSVFDLTLTTSDIMDWNEIDPYIDPNHNQQLYNPLHNFVIPNTQRGDWGEVSSNTSVPSSGYISGNNVIYSVPTIEHPLQNDYFPTELSTTSASTIASISSNTISLKGPEIEITQCELLTSGLTYAYNGRSARDCKHIDAPFAVLHARVQNLSTKPWVTELTAFLGNSDGSCPHETARFASGKHRLIHGKTIHIEASTRHSISSTRDFKWTMFCQGIEFDKRSRSNPRIQDYELRATVVFSLSLLSFDSREVICQISYVSPVIDLSKSDPELIARSIIVTNSSGVACVRVLAFFDNAFDPKKNQILIHPPNRNSIELDVSVVKPSDNKLVQVDVPMDFVNLDWIVQSRRSVQKRLHTANPPKKSRGFSCANVDGYVYPNANETNMAYASFRH